MAYNFGGKHKEMDDPVTKEDLRQFRLLLLHDIRQAMRENTPEGPLDEPEWLRSKAVRKMLGISPGTLQNLRVAGKVGFRKVLGSYYYRKTDLKGLFEEK